MLKSKIKFLFCSVLFCYPKLHYSLILSIQAADKHHVQRMAVTYIVNIYLLLAYKENTCLT